MGDILVSRGSGFSELLDTKEYHDYCEDPFDDVCINAVK